MFRFTDSPLFENEHKINVGIYKTDYDKILEIIRKGYAPEFDIHTGRKMKPTGYARQCLIRSLEQDYKEMQKQIHLDLYKIDIKNYFLNPSHKPNQRR